MTTTFNALKDLDGAICLHSEAYKGIAISIFDAAGLGELCYTLQRTPDEGDRGSTGTDNLALAIGYTRRQVDIALRDLLELAIQVDAEANDGRSRADQIRLTLRKGA